MLTNPFNQPVHRVAVSFCDNCDFAYYVPEHTADHMDKVEQMMAGHTKHSGHTAQPARYESSLTILGDFSYGIE